MKNIGKPCAGEPHARFDEGGQARACPLLYPLQLIFAHEKGRRAYAATREAQNDSRPQTSVPQLLAQRSGQRESRPRARPRHAGGEEQLLNFEPPAHLEFRQRLPRGELPAI